jgi:hypothetical protein
LSVIHNQPIKFKKCGHFRRCLFLSKKKCDEDNIF